jgi:hypothetical protein
MLHFLLNLVYCELLYALDHKLWHNILYQRNNVSISHKSTQFCVESMNISLESLQALNPTES